MGQVGGGAPLSYPEDHLPRVLGFICLLFRDCHIFVLFILSRHLP